LAVVWLASLCRKDASIIDVAWGFGFVVVWTAYAFTTDGPSSRLLLPILTSVWGLRLSGYLTWRNHGKPEDYRYQAMRRKSGDSFPIASLLTYSP
jgi:steroid 5-alpha reductase family enzyme